MLMYPHPRDMSRDPLLIAFPSEMLMYALRATSAETHCPSHFLRKCSCTRPARHQQKPIVHRISFANAHVPASARHEQRPIVDRISFGNAHVRAPRDISRNPLSIAFPSEMLMYAPRATSAETHCPSHFLRKCSCTRIRAT